MTCHRRLDAPSAGVIDLTAERLRRGHGTPPMRADIASLAIGPSTQTAASAHGAAPRSLEVGDRAVVVLSDGRTVAARGRVCGMLVRPHIGTPYQYCIQRDGEGIGRWYRDCDVRPEPVDPAAHDAIAYVESVIREAMPPRDPIPPSAA